MGMSPKKSFSETDFDSCAKVSPGNKPTTTQQIRRIISNSLPFLFMDSHARILP